MKYKSIFLAFLALILAVIAGWAWMSLPKEPPASFRKNVKMTVTIETPAGEVSGSAVREIANEGTNNKVDWPHGGNTASVRGEAVVIDLGEKGKVFGLLAEEGRFYRAFPPPNRHPQSNEAMDYYAALPADTVATLDPDYWPKFVTFTDMDDPKSVTLVRGYEFNPATQKQDLVDNFAELFGAGVRVKTVTLEITDEPVTWGMEKYLGKLHAVGPYEFVKGEPK